MSVSKIIFKKTFDFNEQAQNDKKNYSKIDSVYVFSDGDFIIFGTHEKNDHNNTKCSTLYDGKTFQEKTTFDISSDSCFFDLKDNEFCLCKNYTFEIYEFSNNRTSYKYIMNMPKIGVGFKLMKLSNNDLLYFTRDYLLTVMINIYRKDENNEYKVVNGLIVTDIFDIIELKDNEFLGYKKFANFPESLGIYIFDNKTYKVKRGNKITMEFQNHPQQKRYFKEEIFKWNDDKLIGYGTSNIFIIGMKNLELETILNLNKIINQLFIRPKGNIIVVTYNTKQFDSFGKREYFLNNIEIDPKYNEVSSNKIKNITDDVGIYDSSFQIYDYIDNKLITLIDQKEFKIIENFCD